MPWPTRQRLGELGVLNRDRLKTKARKGWVANDDELKELLSETADVFVLAGMDGKPTEPENHRRCSPASSRAQSSSALPLTTCGTRSR